MDLLSSSSEARHYCRHGCRKNENTGPPPPTPDSSRSQEILAPPLRASLPGLGVVSRARQPWHCPPLTLSRRFAVVLVQSGSLGPDHGHSVRFSKLGPGSGLPRFCREHVAAISPPEIGLVRCAGKSVVQHLSPSPSNRAASRH